MIDSRPLVLNVLASALVGLGFSVFGALAGHSLLACWVFAISACLCFVGGARLGHKVLADKELPGELQFSIEYLSAASLTLVPGLISMSMLTGKFAQAHLGGLLFRGIWVGALLGCFPACLKLNWYLKGKNAVVSAASLHREAQRLRELEQITDAEEKLRESILGLEVHYGTNSIHTARQVVLLGRFLAELGEKEKAHSMFLRALTTFEQVVGPSAPDVADCVLDLVKNDPHTDAETVLPLLRRAQVVREQQFGPESREAAEVWSHLGATHFQASRWNDAAEAYRKSLTILEKVEGATSSTRIQVSGRLASAYVRAGRPLEAEKIIKANLDQRQQMQLPHDGDYLQLLFDYALLHQRQNRPEEERRYLIEALKVLQNSVGPVHPCREELMAASVPHLAPPDSAHAAALGAALAGDGISLRKACQADSTLATLPDETGWNIFQWAVFLNLDRVVDTLLYAGAQADQQETEWPPIHIALRWGHKRILQALLQKGASPSQVTPRGWTSLHRACQADDDRIIDSLVSKGADPNALNDEGDSPLQLAARNNQTRIVIELIHHGADPKNINEKTGRSPLHEAANRGLKQVVDCIILNSPDALNQLDQKGRNAAELAALGGHQELAQSIEKALKLDRREREKEQKARDKASQSGSQNLDG